LFAKRVACRHKKVVKRKGNTPINFIFLIFPS
jgi:hypothetical protein